jgi:HK97 family phage major capsid protein
MRCKKSMIIIAKSQLKNNKKNKTMETETLEEIKKSIASVVDESMEKNLAKAVGPMVAAETKRIVEELRLEKSIFGKDKTGLSDEQKISFAGIVQKAAGFKTKANELLSETDGVGGYLIPVEVEAAILRIAASVGIVLSQAQKWPMGTDEKQIPAYAGSFLEGEYLGLNAAGNNTAITFGQAVLLIKKWQLAFVVGNDLLADANVDVANWLLALAGESLANMIDKQGFAGTGAPFTGITKNASVTVYNMGGSTTSGEVNFDDFTLQDFSDIIASVEESVLDGAAFYFSRTVWAKIRCIKDGTYYILPYAGAASNGVLANNPTGGGVRVAGEIMGFPVFTCRHLPAWTATAISTICGVFGNLKCLAFGQKTNSMTVEQFRSGTFGAKEIALADQQGLVYKHRHALVVALPAGLVNIKTSAS